MTIKLLIVDDHEVIRFGLRAALAQSSDIQIVADVADGVAGLAEAMEKKPDVVLMDIRMPLMDGIAATKEIKSRLISVRVLILTSTDSKEDIFAALAAGADGYCLKDALSGDIVRAIQTVYSGATWLDPRIAQLVLRAASSSFSLGGAQSEQKNDSFMLSQREIDILKLLVEGLTNSEMAERLCISLDTVKTHMKHIMEKLQVSDRTKAAVKAMREGLV